MTGASIIAVAITQLAAGGDSTAGTAGRKRTNWMSQKMGLLHKTKSVTQCALNFLGKTI